MLRKPRPDSVIGSQLPPIIKDDVDTMLLSGESYRKVQQRLEEDGIKLPLPNPAGASGPAEQDGRGAQQDIRGGGGRGHHAGHPLRRPGPGRLPVLRP